MTKYGFEKLGTDNYSIWRTRMRGFLQSKGLGAAIMNAEDADNEKAKGLLIMCVEDQHLQTVSTAETAADAWTALENLYQQRSTASRIRLKREMSTLRKRDDESVAEYISRARSLADQIEAAGAEMDEDSILHSVLSGLPAKYDMIVTIMTTADELPSLAEAQAKLLLVEGDRKTNTRGNGEAAYFSSSGGNNKGSTPPSGSKVYVPPHKRSEGHKGNYSGGRPEKRTCFYCKKKGHLKADCRKRKADMERDGASGDRAAVVALTAHYNPETKELTAADAVEKPKLPWILTANDFDTEDPINQWVLDSGAGKHITGHRDILLNYKELPQPRPIEYGDGKILEAVGVGDVVMARSLSKDAKLVARGVLHVPGNKMNLLSVSAATAKGITVEFSPQMAHIYKGADLIAGAAQVQGLYMLYTPPVYAKETILLANPKESAVLWHKRFGHIGYSGLERLVSSGMVTGINLGPHEIKQAAASGVCGTCVDAKQTRMPFGAAEDKSAKPLDLIHMDLCGPMAETSLGGHEYVATFLDDYSRLSVVVPLKRKSDVAQAVKDTFALMENQIGAKIKNVRTDNGTEYVNETLGSYFKQKGITHQRSAPYSPQQNGRAERLNRTLMEKTRAMLGEAGLPQEMWGEAVATANFVRNRSPVTGKDKTPWELFFGRRPDVSILRTFGCRAYVHIPKEKRTKLDNISDPGIMIGYMPGGNGYRIMMDDGHIVTSRDVVFDERTGQASDTPHEAAEEPEKIGDKSEEPSDAEDESDDPPYTPPGGGDDDSDGDSGGDDASAADDTDAADNTGGAAASTGTRTSSRSNKGVAPGEWWRTCAATASIITEPQTLQEALKSEHADGWKTAMQEEHASLLANNTYVLEMPPNGVKPIPCKWVYKVKKDATGGFERFKARLVIKGFRQKEGIDFHEVFAPVSKFATARTLFSKAAAEGMEIHHVDIKTAFLNGELEEKIYMTQPPGFEEGPPGMACRLIKTLYGLKQAPRAWYTRLMKELELYGFKASDADPSLFTLNMKEDKAYLLVYVDDILVASKSREMIESIKEKLFKSFEGRDLGEIKSFLGMNITRDKERSSLKIDQTGLAESIIQQFGLEEGKTRSTPFGTSARLTATEGDPLNTEKYPYSTLVGKLMYLAVATRPDLAYSVSALTRFMSKPTLAHWQAAKGVVRYLAHAPGKGITYCGNSTELKAFCDADYAGDLDTRRSTTGYVFLMNGGAISWNSKRQPTVAASTTEAEYMAAAAAVKEGLWMRKLLNSLDVRPGVVDINCDNQSAIKLLKNPIFSARSKHIDVLHHFARERVLRKEVAFHYISTKEMLADILTKPLPTEQHQELCKQMGLY
jgi:hypothetical protein